jgi:hypothetical protein
VAESLESVWGVLGLLSPPKSDAVYPPTRHRAIAVATLRVVDALVAVGDRYALGLPYGASIWELPTNLTYVLGQLGVPGAPGFSTAFERWSRPRGGLIDRDDTVTARP